MMAESFGPEGSAVLAFVTAFGLSSALTPLLRAWARRRGWLDHPDWERKTHAQPIPRVGGAGVFVSFALTLGLCVLVAGGTVASPAAHHGHLVLACAAVMLVGLADDVRGATPRTKILVQLAAASYLYAHGWRIGLLTNPFGESISLGFLSLPVTLLWFVGISNAFNLIDGLDGLAAGVGFFALASLAAYALINAHWAGAVAAIALGGALLGFLPYNFSPATIFLGDSGSLFLGFALSALAISNSSKASTAIAVVAPLFALALPIADVFLAILRRSVAGRHIFTPDREHIHHKLLQMGFTPRRAVLVLYGVSALFSLLSILAMTGPVRLIAALVLGGALLALIGVRQLGYAELDFQRILESRLVAGRRKKSS